MLTGVLIRLFTPQWLDPPVKVKLIFALAGIETIVELILIFHFKNL